MKRQSAKVQAIKGKIASLINLVKLGIKKYILRLLDLEAELADALQGQIKKVVKMEIPEGYEKPYSQLAKTLSVISGIDVDTLYVKVENKQKSPFLPEELEYHVLNSGVYTESQINEAWVSESVEVASHDALTSWDGTRQGYVH